jgi:hypothetical protein
MKGVKLFSDKINKYDVFHTRKTKIELSIISGQMKFSLQYRSTADLHCKQKRDRISIG